MTLRIDCYSALVSYNWARSLVALVLMLGVPLSVGLPDVRAMTKSELIRSLLRERLEILGIFEQFRREFEATPYVVLMGVPEATIVVNVESYVAFKRQGLDDSAIFARIEAHRATLGATGVLPSPLTLETYIEYRLKLDHPEGSIPPGFVRRAIQRSLEFFSR
jgi:hypothetical protein